MTNTEQEYVTGWACADCLMMLANGETDPNWTEEETAEYLARLDAREVTGETVTLGLMYGEEGCEHTTDDNEGHAEECEQVSFSWSPCDVCGSRLGGSRDAVTFWVATS